MRIVLGSTNVTKLEALKEAIIEFRLDDVLKKALNTDEGSKTEIFIIDIM
jgi:hypothetical protein